MRGGWTWAGRQNTLKAVSRLLSGELTHTSLSEHCIRQDGSTGFFRRACTCLRACACVFVGVCVRARVRAYACEFVRVACVCVACVSHACVCVLHPCVCCVVWALCLWCVGVGVVVGVSVPPSGPARRCTR